MSANVTSIAEIRAAARRQSDRAVAANRQVTLLLLIVGTLLVIGLTETISAASTVEIREQVERFSYFKRQLIGVGLGTVVLWLAAKVPYQTYRRLAIPLYGGVVGLLVLVLIVGRRAGGAIAWIDLGPVSFQPSEVAKFGVIVTLAMVMERKARSLETWLHFLAPVITVVGIVAILVMLQPDLGTLIVIGAAAMAVLLTSNAPVRYLIPFGVLSSLTGVLLAYADTERWSRLTSFLNPWADPGDSGWQVIQSFYALGNGGLFGVGLGASRARWYYLPNAHTDFIFAIIGEETGLVGAMAVLCLFGCLTVLGWSITAKTVDPFGRMLSAGIVAWISFQAVINIGGVLGALPITGIPLPFVSFGGTAVIVTMGAIGVLINIAGQARGAKARS